MSDFAHWGSVEEAFGKIQLVHTLQGTNQTLFSKNLHYVKISAV
jgi:hypothetical protein